MRISTRGLVATASVLGLSAFAASAEAAEWIHHPATAPSSASPTQVARTYLASQAAELDIDGVDLDVHRVLPTSRHKTVRFVQTHKGLPVLGAAAAVRVAPDGRITTAVLDVARDLEVDVTPALTTDEALLAAETYLGQALIPAKAPQLVVHPTLHAGGALVWLIDVQDIHGGFRVFVDAHSGEALFDVPLAADALGRVYEISSVVTPTPIDVELTALDPANPQRLSGFGGQLLVANYVAGGVQSQSLEIEHTLEPNSGDDYLYDPPGVFDATDGFAQVAIFHHLTRAHNFFTDVIGLDMSDPSWKVIGVANLLENGSPLDNAFFSQAGINGGGINAPNLIGIGQGTNIDFADDSDVFIHEFMHYVSHNAVGYNVGQAGVDEYGLQTFAGSIDEGISDYFACTENDDPLLGEASLAFLGGARDLTDTSKSCPGDMFGEVHGDGEIIASFGWTLRETYGREVADQLVWGATTLLTPTASLGDFAEGTIATAQALVAEGALDAAAPADIEMVAAGRGLDNCGRVLDISDGMPLSMQLIGLDLLAQGFGGGSCDNLKSFGASLQTLFHFSYTPEANDEQLRFSVNMLALGSGDLDYSIYVRTGQHVGFTPNGFLPTATDYDYAVEGITTATGEIVIDASSDPPFDPSQTYYMVVGHQNCPFAQTTISANATSGGVGGGGAGGAGTGGMPPVNPGGAGVGGEGNAPGATPGDDDDGGCGCRVAGTDSSPAPWALLGLAGLLVAGRRRRRW